MFKSHVKLLSLNALEHKSCSGYDIMKALGQAMGKKPSPGYVYPLLHDLEQKGLVSVKALGRRKIYTLTKEGRDFLESLRARQERTMQCMSLDLEPLGEGEEMEFIARFHERLRRYKTQMVSDFDVWGPFFEACFEVYAHPSRSRRAALRTMLARMARQVGSRR